MKLRLFVPVVLVSVLLIVVGMNIVLAQWSAIKDSGYAVTTNWHGEDVPLGEPVTAWAGTTNPEVIKVEFKWHDPAPAENLVWDVNITVFGPYETPDVPSNVPQEIIDWAEKYPGYTIWYADNTQTPDVLGDWGIQAFFHDSGNIQGQDSTIVAIRSTSGNVIPEAPLGTIAIALTILAGYSFIVIRKRKIPLPF